MSSSKYYNPLAALPDTKTNLSSNSASTSYTATAMTNTEAGVCPKCKTKMGTAQIETGDDVFYCTSCRVAQPMPNKTVKQGTL